MPLPTTELVRHAHRQCIDLQAREPFHRAPRRVTRADTPDLQRKRHVSHDGAMRKEHRLLMQVHHTALLRAERGDVTIVHANDARVTPLQTGERAQQ